MRIVSLIASATETVCALGCERLLVGRSHECDFPPSIRRLPVCTEPKFDISGTSAEIDRRVKDVLRDSLSVYRVFADVLDELAPDVVLTQAHCEVCNIRWDCDLERNVEVSFRPSARIRTVDDREFCLQTGMNDYVSKPVKRDTLAAALTHWAERVNG